MEKKIKINKINKRKKTYHIITESRGNEVLMLLLSLRHYYANQKLNAQHTYIVIN